MSNDSVELREMAINLFRLSLPYQIQDYEDTYTEIMK